MKIESSPTVGRCGRLAVKTQNTDYTDVAALNLLFVLEGGQQTREKRTLAKDILMPRMLIDSTKYWVRAAPLRPSCTDHYHSAPIDKSARG